MDSDLLTTTEAAKLLHCSRQHVVDMCDRGELSFIFAGKHRRLNRRDLEALLAAPARREDELALWIDYALAAKLVMAPDAVIERAKTRLQRLRAAHSDGSSNKWFDRWQIALDEGPHAVLALMTSRTEEAATMRSCSPVAGLGLLSGDERQQVRASFRAHWLSQHRQAA
jgi:excisionase family DNA binding protein